ncbi:MAG: hypothetical protein K9K79_02080 [Desulfohalobiaceae bacterium]|nr:hypothetical protein [Desulfohalobiaceae bacterium]
MSLQHMGRLMSTGRRKPSRIELLKDPGNLPGRPAHCLYTEPDPGIDKE